MGIFFIFPTDRNLKEKILFSKSLIMDEYGSEGDAHKQWQRILCCFQNCCLSSAKPHTGLF